MIFLISNGDLKIFGMDCTEKINSDYLAMAELTKEIGSLVQRTINEGNKELTASDIEYILKITSDVTLRIKSKSPEITV